MDIFKAISRLPKIVTGIKDLAEKIVELHDDPEFQKLMASNPEIKAKADAISRDSRTIQEALR